MDSSGCGPWSTGSGLEWLPARARCVDRRCVGRSAPLALQVVGGGHAGASQRVCSLAGCWAYCQVPARSCFLLPCFLVKSLSLSSSSPSAATARDPAALGFVCWCEIPASPGCLCGGESDMLHALGASPHPDSACPHLLPSPTAFGGKHLLPSPLICTSACPFCAGYLTFLL